MRTERIDETLLTKYLLGGLSEEGQVEVEDRAFADPTYLEALEATEADLIDSYVRGELTEPDRRQFERRFLISSQRRRKVEFAKALAQVAAEAKASQPPAQARISGWQALLNALGGSGGRLQFAAAMAGLILIAGVTWLGVQNAALRSRLTSLEAQHRGIEAQEQSLRNQLSQEEARAARLSAESQQQTNSRPERPPLLASLVFLPGLSRGESHLEQLALDSGAQVAHIEIRLEARDDFPRFRAELRTRRGEEILSRTNLPKGRSDGGFSVSFDIPASALPSGEYELALKGMADGQTTDIGYYYFRVQRH